MYPTTYLKNKSSRQKNIFFHPLRLFVKSLNNDVLAKSFNFFITINNCFYTSIG